MKYLCRAMTPRRALQAKAKRTQQNNQANSKVVTKYTYATTTSKKKLTAQKIRVY